MPRVFLPLLAAVALAACAAGDKSPEPTPTREPFIDTTPQAVATAPSELRDALLDPADLGDGWSEEGLGDATEADTYYCGTKLELTANEALAIFVHDEGRVVFEGIVVLADEAAAAAELQSVRQAHEGCDDFISTDGDRRTDWHTEAFHDIALADEAVLEIASTESFGAVPATSYNVALRQGAAIIIVSLIGANPDDDGERQITDIAAAALAEYERATRP